MKLVIVESPTKSNTIGHYLGDEYVVEASVGHIRDLAISGKGGLGVDVDHDFKPNYKVNSDKSLVVKKLLELKNKADEVILATDPDREGEAIAWHLASVLELPIETTTRLEFHEITKSSIKNALANPRTIDMNLVHSQEARRIIDRIIGFKLSGLLKSKIKSQSAGRVQSVTLKMIVEREKEIEAFVPEEFYSVKAAIKVDGVEYQLNLNKFKDFSSKLPNKEIADELVSHKKDKFHVVSISKNQKSVASKEPYRTSTLQQEAITKLGFSSKEVTILSQQLYEGVEINGQSIGLITYIRTDSTNLSEFFVNDAKKLIISTYGENNYKGTKAAKTVLGAQGAHEAIRPTDLSLKLSDIKPYLNEKQFKLYKLIFERALASLMSDKVIETTNVLIENEDGSIKFDLKGTKTLFKGYTALRNDDEEEKELPPFKEGDLVKLSSLKSKQDFTKAPSRYSEAKIINLMEEKGIGRPSTYSSTIQTLISRKYVSKSQGTLKPTEQGVLTSNVLNKYFPDLMNTEYTSAMETHLDQISDGSANEISVIREFYEPFEEHFEEVKEVMYKEPLKTTGEKCPVCGADLVYRQGKYGQFVGCSNYPTCNYIKKEKQDLEEVGRNCPDCGSPLVYRFNKRGDKFIGCSNFPKCKHIESLAQPTNENYEQKTCPECGHPLVVKFSRGRPFYGCSNYPSCKHVEKIEKK